MWRGGIAPSRPASVARGTIEPTQSPIMASQETAKAAVRNTSGHWNMWWRYSYRPFPLVRHYSLRSNPT